LFISAFQIPMARPRHQTPRQKVSTLAKTEPHHCSRHI
jgi:hypothetical protein